MMALLALPPPESRENSARIDTPYRWTEIVEPARPTRWERTDLLGRLRLWWLRKNHPLRRAWMNAGRYSYTMSVGFGGDPEVVKQFRTNYWHKAEPSRPVNRKKPRSMSAAAAHAYGYKP